MGAYICKLKIGDKEYYSIIESVIDMFVAPAFSNPSNFAKFAALYFTWRYDEPYTAESCLETLPGIKTVFALDRWTIHEATRLLAKMKTGEQLDEDEACLLNGFYRFLRFAIADHQHEYPELSREAVGRWIDELDLRRQFREFQAREELAEAVKKETLDWEKIKRATALGAKLERGETLTPAEDAELVRFLNLSDDFTVSQARSKEWDWQDILDHAKYTTFQSAAMKREHPKSDYQPELRADAAGLAKLAGRYVSKMAIIARIAGINRRTPMAIVDFYREKDKVGQIDSHQSKLGKCRAYDRPHKLLGAYKQLIRSRKGRQAEGEYRRLLEQSPKEGFEFVAYLCHRLEEAGLGRHAARLRQEYL